MSSPGLKPELEPDYKMARLKKVEPEIAVFSAMALFWKQGFHNTSTRQIEDETGITRFSLQTTYGGKMALFLKALDHYLDMFELQFSPKMTDGALEPIAAWFETLAAPEMNAELASFGCLLLNTTVEFSSEDQAVNERAARFYAMVGDGFLNALKAVKAAGNLPANFDCEAHAQTLLAAAIGLNITIRAAVDNEAGKVMAKSTADLVRSWGA